MIDNIVIRLIDLNECIPNLFKDFNRYQEVKRCWRNENGTWLLKDIYYIIQWDEKEKANRISSLTRLIESGGYIFGAFKNNDLIGFSSLSTIHFGRNDEYMQLEMLHVSYEYRSMGIGKRLFFVSCEKARQLGAGKLYISAHSAEEPVAFYKAVGCNGAKEINQKQAEEEPYDCQLEYVL